MRWRYGRCHRNWPVAREDSFAQEVFGFAVNRKLKISIAEPIGDALLKGLHQALDLAHFHHSFDLCPRHKPQPHRCDDAEEPVSSVRQAKQFEVLSSTAIAGIPGRIHQHKRLDVVDERFHFKTASVRVGRDGAGNCEPVGARLFLGNSPRLSVTILQCEIAIDEIRPLDAGLDFENSAISIEMQNSVHLADVDEHRVCAKLLPAHCVPAAGNRNMLPVLPRRANDLLHVL